MKSLMSIIGSGVVMGAAGYGAFMLMDKMCKKNSKCQKEITSPYMAKN